MGGQVHNILMHFAVHLLSPPPETVLQLLCEWTLEVVPTLPEDAEAVGVDLGLEGGLVGAHVHRGREGGHAGLQLQPVQLGHELHEGLILAV